MHLRSLLFMGVLVVCVIGLALRPAAQQRAPGMFRTRITLVPVDVRVVDRDGKPITDLKQDEFIVLEDGVRQRIQHFSLQLFGATTTEPSTDTKPMLRQVPKLELMPQTNRIFLIVLGRGRLQVPSNGVDAALRFVRQHLLPQDYVAVLAYNRATDFTRDHERVAQVLERFRRLHESIEAKLSNQQAGLASVYGGQHVPSSLQAPIEEIFRGPGTAGTRDVPSGGAGQDPSLTKDQRRINDSFLAPSGGTMGERAGTGRTATPAAAPATSLDQVQQNIYTDLPFEEYVQRSAETMQDLGNIQAGIEYLRYLEGEKHLVFVTERGLFLPRVESDRSLAALASDARVVIDTIQTGGLPSGPPMTGSSRGVAIPGPSFTERFAIASLRNVSMLTGGQSSAYEYADKALNRIDETTRVDYLIGYYPTNSNWDGRYRRIVVRVTRPGLTVLFRHGYNGSEVMVPLDHQAYLTYRRVAAAGNYDREVHDIEVKAKAAVVRDQATKLARQVTVEIVLDVSKLKFKDVDDRHVATVDLAFFCADDRERMVGELWQKMDLKLKDETYQKALKEGMPYKFALDVKGEPHYVKVIAYNYDVDLVGSVIVRPK